MHLLCDAIDLKQLVESTLKVQEKSLTAVLDEVYSIVNLYSSPYSWFPRQTRPEGMSSAPSQAEQLLKLPPISLLTSIF